MTFNLIKFVNMKFLNYLFFLFFTTIATQTIAQLNIFKNYNLKDGLPSLNIIDITQDNDGYLWFASNKGITRFDGIDLTTLNQEAAKITGQKQSEKTMESSLEIDLKSDIKIPIKKKKETKTSIIKRRKGRPKSSSRKPLNTAIEPKNRQRLEFLAMLNGGSVADQLNDILERYFTEIEKVDELIDLFEERKQKK